MLKTNLLVNDALNIIWFSKQERGRLNPGSPDGFLDLALFENRTLLSTEVKNYHPERGSSSVNTLKILDWSLPGNGTRKPSIEHQLTKDPVDLDGGMELSAIIMVAILTTCCVGVAYWSRDMTATDKTPVLGGLSEEPSGSSVFKLPVPSSFKHHYRTNP